MPTHFSKMQTSERDVGDVIWRKIPRMLLKYIIKDLIILAIIDRTKQYRKNLKPHVVCMVSVSFPKHVLKNKTQLVWENEEDSRSNGQVPFVYGIIIPNAWSLEEGDLLNPVYKESHFNIQYISIHLARTSHKFGKRGPTAIHGH